MGIFVLRVTVNEFGLVQALFGDFIVEAPVCFAHLWVKVLQHPIDQIFSCLHRLLNLILLDVSLSYSVTVRTPNCQTLASRKCCLVDKS